WLRRPAAAQRLVDGDQRDHAARLALSLCVLRRIDGALRVEDGEEALQAACVSLGRQIACASVRCRRFAKNLEPATLAGGPGERVLDVRHRAEHGLFVVPQRLLLPGVLRADAGADASPREHGQPDATEEKPELARGGTRNGRIFASARE